MRLQKCGSAKILGKTKYFIGSTFKVCIASTCSVIFILPSSDAIAVPALAEITFPATLAKLYKNDFYKCTALKSVTFTQAAAPVVSSSTFSGLTLPPLGLRVKN